MYFQCTATTKCSSWKNKPFFEHPIFFLSTSFFSMLFLLRFFYPSSLFLFPLFYWGTIPFLILTSIPDCKKLCAILFQKKVAPFQYFLRFLFEAIFVSLDFPYKFCHIYPWLELDIGINLFSIKCFFLTSVHRYSCTWENITVG